MKMNKMNPLESDIVVSSSIMLRRQADGGGARLTRKAGKGLPLLPSSGPGQCRLENQDGRAGSTALPHSGVSPCPSTRDGLSFPCRSIREEKMSAERIDLPQSTRDLLTFKTLHSALNRNGYFRTRPASGLQDSLYPVFIAWSDPAGCERIGELRRIPAAPSTTS